MKVRVSGRTLLVCSLLLGGLLGSLLCCCLLALCLLHSSCTHSELMLKGTPCYSLTSIESQARWPENTDDVQMLI